MDPGPHDPPPFDPALLDPVLLYLRDNQLQPGLDQDPALNNQLQPDVDQDPGPYNQWLPELDQAHGANLGMGIDAQGGVDQGHPLPLGYAPHFQHHGPYTQLALDIDGDFGADLGMGIDDKLGFNLNHAPHLDYAPPPRPPARPAAPPPPPHPAQIALEPTAVGFVANLADAIHVVQAAAEGRLPLITKRPATPEEQGLIRSGHVLVYEKNTGIGWWTDGRHWSESRQHGGFGLYREVNSRAVNANRGAKRCREPRADVDPERRPYLASHVLGPENPRGNYKPGGLMKKSIEVMVDGRKFGLVAYYDPDEAMAGHIRRVRDQDARLRDVIPLYGSCSLGKRTQVIDDAGMHEKLDWRVWDDEWAEHYWTGHGIPFPHPDLQNPGDSVLLQGRPEALVQHIYRLGPPIESAAAKAINAKKARENPREDPDHDPDAPGPGPAPQAERQPRNRKRGAAAAGLDDPERPAKKAQRA